MCDIYVEVNEKAYYPNIQNLFNPDTYYLEYPWGENCISKEKNYVYEMVRNVFLGYGLDKENKNTKYWNPLGMMIEEGQTVLIKPNWVMHENGNKYNKKNSMECLVTHPSIVKVVCDYVYIALRGNGKIIVGDAPMQGCNLKELLDKTGYSKILEFYKDRGLDISFVDFREYESIMDKNKVIVEKKYTGEKNVCVNLDTFSKHYSKNNNKEYQVSDYDKIVTKKYHHGEIHSYSISKTALSADIVINICKPKTHRLAGFTAALKNIVGITYNKACLPHRTVGSQEEGGDEYKYKSRVKKAISYILHKKVIFENRGNKRLALLMRYIYGVLYYAVYITGKDKYLIGSWYGNDTIWRTVLDLNVILKYTDKQGNMHDITQRKVLNIADMIISGEKTGPVSPSPKELGIIMISENPVIMDRIVCEIMGFDYKKIPGLYEALSDDRLINVEKNLYKISSNSKKLNNYLQKIEMPKKWYFIAHPSWKGRIEKEVNSNYK